MAAAAQSPSDLDFLSNQVDGRELRRMLPNWLRRQAAVVLEGRNVTDPAARRALVRARMEEAAGGWPERTPLNARITGQIERDDHRIEKVIFESQPGFYVTANLYLPKTGRPPYPGVLFPLGHEPGGKANPTWQQILVTLARRGYVALAWDTLGQGERIQLWDEDLGGSKLRASTTEHTIQGVQCLLVGDSLARYTIWDGMRALDYLLSRKEVDAARIGCTGNSGGGTHTAYLAALEDRIHVAAPSCYLTSWGRLLDTIGPQDAEQCLPGFLGAGLDHPDFVHAFAPRPYLILSAIRDFFSIAGARSTYDEAQRIYTQLDAREKVKQVEADDGHGYSKPRRQAAYEWFARWLKNTEDQREEAPVTVAREDELWCTRSGQVASELGGETVFTLNRKRAEGLKRTASKGDVARMLGLPEAGGPPPVQTYGTLDRAGLRVEKLVYESEPGIRVPALLVIPPSPSGPKPAAILVNSRGKAAAWPEAEALAGAGLVVLAVDVRGCGETRAIELGKGGDWPSFFGDYDSAMTAILLGKSLVGMRAADLRRGIDLLAARPEVDARRIYGVGRQEGAVPLLHLGAADARLGKLALDGMLVSYGAVIRHRIHRGVFENVIFGVLKSYDLPDLAAWMAPRPVWLVDVVDPVGNPLAAEAVKTEYAAAPGVKILRRRPEEPASRIYRSLFD